jgi:hypothetical protein
MTRIILLVALAPIFFLSPTASVKGTAPDEPVPARMPPRVPQNDAANLSYWGAVTELTKTSITIQFDAQKSQKPKQFLVSEVLAAGKVPMNPRLIAGQPRGYTVGESMMYRLTDVKVGDWVDISYAHLGDADICDHICIKKRPGGRVPPLPDEAEALRKHKRYPGEPEPVHIRYDEWVNAYWNLEDHGTAYPEKFGPNRRFPPAPPPREVKSAPATAP